MAISSLDMAMTVPNTTVTTPVSPFYTGFLTFRQGVGVWELILCTIGTPLNILVLFLARKILKKMDQQQNQHLSIFSMAAADLLFSTVHCPAMFVNYALSIDFQNVPCRMLYLVTHQATVASSLSLLCLNLDKYVSLRWPLRYHGIVTYRRTKICLIFSWLISFGWALFFVFGPLTAFEDECQVYTIEPHAYITFFTLFFVFPIVFSLCISLYIMAVTIGARKADCHRISICTRQSEIVLPNNNVAREHLLGSTATLENGPKSASEAACDTPVLAVLRPVSKVKTVTFVFSATLWASITFIPYRTAYLFYHFYEEDDLARVSFGLFALMVSNAAGNPLVTIATQHQYRERVKKIFIRNGPGSETTSEEGSLERRLPLR